MSADADDNSFDGYQGADVPLTGGGYVQGYAPHIDIVQNSKGKMHLIKFKCYLCSTYQYI